MLYKDVLSRREFLSLSEDMTREEVATASEKKDNGKAALWKSFFLKILFAFRYPRVVCLYPISVNAQALIITNTGHIYSVCFYRAFFSRLKMR